MNKNKSVHERVAAVVAGQKVEEYKARHAYLHSLNRGREEYGTFWLKSDHSTFGHTFGRMMGFRELVPAHFGEPLRAMPFLPATPKADKGGPGGPGGPDGPGGPADLGDAMGTPGDDFPQGMPFGSASKKKFDRPTEMEDIYGFFNLYGHNASGTFGQGAHVLASPVIEVADDGKSAKAFYLTPGTMMSMNGPNGGRSGSYLWERYGSEFVYRDGRWWWFHEQVCPDIADSYDDSNWAQDRFRKYVSGQLKVGNCAGAPKSGISDLRQAHNDISIIQTVQDTAPNPKPYETLNEENTISPNMTEFEDIYIYPNNKGYGDPIY